MYIFGDLFRFGNPVCDVTASLPRTIAGKEDKGLILSYSLSFIGKVDLNIQLWFNAFIL